MEIRILQLFEGAKKAEGLTVIIDVFRAFSVACYTINNGAREIIPVADLTTAYQLKEENPDVILIGERDGRTLPGFDYGNSPSLIEGIDFNNKVIVHSTSSGTQGIVKAEQAEEIITGSFVNARAVVNYIRSKSPEILSLVCMGYAGLTPTDEDIFCARYISDMLENRETDLINIREQLLVGSGKRFFDPANRDWSPPGDFELCLAYNRFDFVLKAKPYREDLLVLKKVVL